MKRIKVLQVLNFVGGVEICVRQIIENIDSKQIENIVLSQNIGSKRKITNSKKQKIKHYELYYSEANKYSKRSIRYYKNG